MYMTETEASLFEVLYTAMYASIYNMSTSTAKCKSSPSGISKSSDVLDLLKNQLPANVRDRVITDIKAGILLDNLNLNVTNKKDSELVICRSSGIDSTIADYYATILGKRPQNLFIDYGASYNDLERRSLTKLLASKESLTECSVTIGGRKISIPSYMLPKQYIFPLRNAVLATIAAIVCLPETGGVVWLVSNWRGSDGGGVSDKSREFMDTLSSILTAHLGKSVIVTSPFFNLTKNDSIEWLMANIGENETRELLGKCVSCYNARKNRCGDCYACYKSRKVSDKYGLGYTYERELSSLNKEVFDEREASKGR